MLTALILTARVAVAPPVTGYHANIDTIARRNQDFRRVLFTGEHSQVVVMSIRPGESIGREVHRVDQCLYFVSGRGEADVAGVTTRIAPRDLVCVPAGVEHDIRNTGRQPLDLFTIYAPPQHAPGTVHHTRSDAEHPERR